MAYRTNPLDNVADRAREMRDRAGEDKSYLAKILIGAGAVVFAGCAFIASYSRVDMGETGLVTTLGKWDGNYRSPGLHWIIPGIQKFTPINTTKIHRLEIGYETVSPGGDGRAAIYKEIPSERLRLTADKNLSIFEVGIPYTINDAAEYNFNFMNHEAEVRRVALGVMTGVIGSHTLDETMVSGLPNGRLQIASQIQELMQKYCDQEHLGVTIAKNINIQNSKTPDEVETARKGIINAGTGARTAITAALTEYNSSVPQKRDQATSSITKADGSAVAKINAARGEALGMISIIEQLAGVQNPQLGFSRILLDAANTFYTHVGDGLLTNGGGNSDLATILHLTMTPGGEQK